MTTKSYSEMLQYDTYADRFHYLQLFGAVGDETFGNYRYLNQIFYSTPEWRRVRDRVILRDDGNDMGLRGYRIAGSIYVHHINPITIEDILKRRPIIFDMDNLISLSFETHQAISYCDDTIISSKSPVIRTKNDTCPWRKY